MKERVRLAAVVMALLTLTAVVVALAIPDRASAQTETDPTSKVISVTGQAEVEVIPDMATISFGVETNASTAQQAQAENSALMNQVIYSLVSMGISKQDIQTSNFSLYPVYEWQGEKPEMKQVLVGYRCNNTVTVKVRDTGKVGAVIDAAIKAGANNVGGISFGLQDSKKQEEQALAAAVQNARKKAEIMAEAAGVKITGVIRISDGWVSLDSFAAGAYGKGLEGAAPIEAGTLKIRASVRMDFGF